MKAPKIRHKINTNKTNVKEDTFRTVAFREMHFP
jgi:hypothetical protein